MNKAEILAHFRASMKWIEGMKEWEEANWRSPIAEGKWTVAEVIGHLAPWDKFFLNERLHPILAGGELQPYPGSDELNAQSATLAREQSRNDTVHEFLVTRNKLVEELSAVPEAKWQQPFTIGSNTTNLENYFTGLVEHDEHHFEQIRQALDLKGRWT
ncbi:DinB family protein [Chryseomicrobium sp. FSL W7-1435]|uniref:DinB family protein n=1 Tax=Chryseomicrobium sp. FSL W7-1435 TaxID=2921704 RepID=UPI00315B28C6